MKLLLLKAGFVALTLSVTACTANYLDINSNPYEVGGDKMQTDGYAISAALTALSGTVISNDVNTTQFTECLLGGPMGGYFVTSGKFARTIDNYNPTDNWTNVFMASGFIIPVLYSNLKDLEKATDDPIALAIGQIIKVCVMHRVTDTYGPIPYSKVKVGGNLQVAYDSQKAVYDKLFEELNDAIDKLTANKTGSIVATSDYIYGGSAMKWCKLANSIKLRLAMRIVYADPQKAREMAESAVASEVGVFTSNEDNAKVTSFGGSGNPISVAVKYNTQTHSDQTVCGTGGDTHVAADITSYMNAYNDPRRAKYFTTSEWLETYVGMRRGIIVPDIGTIGHKYSGLNIQSTSPMYWINAAEVAFLKAEASAVFGFNMGSGSAKEFYEEGVRLSFEQHGVAADYANYISQSGNIQVSYTDPAGTNSYGEILSSTQIPWDEGATAAQKQERIIIQKWIANWQIGNEAWADYRRTGYPKLIPATTDGNMSNGIVESRLGARRMPYPQAEYTTNSQNIKTAVSTHLKGKDNMATRIWWDCNPAIQ